MASSVVHKCGFINERETVSVCVYSTCWRGKVIYLFIYMFYLFVIAIPL